MVLSHRAVATRCNSRLNLWPSRDSPVLRGSACKICLLYVWIVSEIVIPPFISVLRMSHNLDSFMWNPWALTFIAEMLLKFGKLDQVFTMSLKYWIELSTRSLLKQMNLSTMSHKKWYRKADFGTKYIYEISLIIAPWCKSKFVVK